MAFSLATQSQPPGDPLYYEAGFRTVIETHLPILRHDPRTQREVISADRVHQFEGDFYGLLAHLGHAPHLHWLFLRVNNMEAPHQFGQVFHDPYQQDYQFVLLIPPEDVIRDLKLLYQTTSR